MVFFGCRMWSLWFIIVISFLLNIEGFSRVVLLFGLVRWELFCEGYFIDLWCLGSDVIMIESVNYGWMDDKICDVDLF